MVDGESLLVLRDVVDPEDVSPVDSVVHRISARVFVIRLDEDAFDLLSHDSRVAYIGDDPPADLIDDLGDQEHLFVSGWRLRGRQVERTGDGLSWDAEGMTPPDLPHRQE